jgi:hypothetical protein
MVMEKPWILQGQYHIGYMIIVVEEKYYVNSHSTQVLDIIEVHCPGIPHTGLNFWSQPIKTTTPRTFSPLTEPDIRRKAFWLPLDPARGPEH